MIEKPHYFKQPTPGMQHTALLSAIEGNLLNVMDGITTLERAMPEINRLLENLHTLGNWYKETW